jgi:hypothetical protein
VRIVAVLPEEEDEEIEYGKLYTSSLEEESKLLPLKKEDIWPHWNDGVPTKLRRKLGSPSFVLGTVRHEYREYYETLDFKWNDMRKLSFLKENYHHLPGNYESQWSGVYRIFAPDKVIHRFCGKDPTGTLYLGRAGSVRGWSILRTRIMSIAKREHHATQNWDFSELIRQKFPWESLAVEWACTGKRTDYKGQVVLAAKLAETWLLSCYSDSYGEYPPLNQEG